MRKIATLASMAFMGVASMALDAQAGWRRGHAPDGATIAAGVIGLAGGAAVAAPSRSAHAAPAGYQPHPRYEYTQMYYERPRRYRRYYVERPRRFYREEYRPRRFYRQEYGYRPRRAYRDPYAGLPRPVYRRFPGDVPRSTYYGRY
jgi:hypothetical protein